MSCCRFESTIQCCDLCVGAGRLLASTLDGKSASWASVSSGIIVVVVFLDRGHRLQVQCDRAPTASHKLDGHHPCRASQLHRFDPAETEMQVLHPGARDEGKRWVGALIGDGIAPVAVKHE